MVSTPSLNDDRQILNNLSFVTKILLGFAMFIPFSWFKKMIFQFLGAQIGKNVFFGPGSMLISNNFKNVIIEDDAFISPGVMISVNHLYIGAYSGIGYQSLLVGDYLTIGSGCNISSRSYIESSYAPISIENNVTIGTSAIITSHDGAYKQTYGCEMKKQPVSIKKGAFIGNNAIILPGIDIGEQAIIGAGAVVTKSVKSKVVVVGVPARIIKSRADNQNDNETIHGHLSEIDNKL